MLDLVQTFKLPELPDTQYTSFAFDGINFYFLNALKPQVLVFDTNFNFVKAITTQRYYASLAWDPEEQAFFAASTDNLGWVFKLNIKFEETYAFLLPPRFSNNNFFGLSYCCGCKSLLTGSASQIIMTDTKGRYTKSVYCDRLCGTICSVTCAAPLVFTSIKREDGFHIVTLGKNCSPLSDISCDEFSIVGSVLLPPRHAYQNYHLLVNALDEQHCSYVLDYEISGDLGEMMCDCNNPNHIEEENEECNRILQCVALKEAQIAKSLDSEGKRIQCAVKCCCSVDDLLCANDTLILILQYAIKTEQELYEELLKVNKICGFDDCICNHCTKKSCGCSCKCPIPYACSTCVKVSDSNPCKGKDVCGCSKCR